MPHYKDGTQAALYDEVVVTDGGAPVSGVVVFIVAGAGSCNLQVAHGAVKEFYVWNPATGKNELAHRFPSLEYKTVNAHDAERKDLVQKRLLEAPKAA